MGRGRRAEVGPSPLQTVAFMVLCAVFALVVSGGFSKYSEEANKFEGEKSTESPPLDKDGSDSNRPYRVQKINLFWTVAQQVRSQSLSVGKSFITL